MPRCKIILTGELETTGTHSYYVDEEDYPAGPEIQYLFLSHVHSGE